MKKCRQCKTPFKPKYSTMQTCCSVICALDYAKAQRWKAFDAETRKRKEGIKKPSKWLAEAQAAFNTWIRLRDNGKACISCGGLTGCKMNAGHYRAVGAAPELRFEPLNVHLQCEHCNSYLSGNPIPYRKNLLLLIGRVQLKWLEGPHEPKKYTIDDIKAIKKKYTLLAKELKSSII